MSDWKTIEERDLEKILTPKGGITQATLALLGEEMKSGWKWRLLGKKVPRETFERACREASIYSRKGRMKAGPDQRDMFGG